MAHGKEPVSHDYEKDDFRTAGLKPFVGNITSASWGPNRIDIFGQDSSGVVEQVYYDGLGIWLGKRLSHINHLSNERCNLSLRTRQWECRYLLEGQ